MTVSVATLSGRIGTLGRVEAVEVPSELWDRARDLKSFWGLSWDDFVTLATDGGRLPLDQSAVRAILEQMEGDAVEMGALKSH